MNSNPVLESIISQTSTNRRGVNKEVVMPLEMVIVTVIVLLTGRLIFCVFFLQENLAELVSLEVEVGHLLQTGIGRVVR